MTLLRAHTDTLRFPSSHALIVMIFCMHAFGVKSWALGAKNSRKKPFFLIISPCRGHKVMTWGEEDAAGEACSKPRLPHMHTHTHTHGDDD
jgi:hypothetical protein